VRVFAAFPLPHAVRAAITSAYAPARARQPHARWVDADGMHLTAHFFGELPPESVSAIVTAMESDRRSVAPIRARLGGPGQFPQTGHARVLWVGLDGGGEELAGFCRGYETLIAPLASSGGPAQAWLPDARGFTPHITVARAGREPLNDGWRNGLVLDLLDFLVEECVLFESILGAGGALYRPLAAIRFDGGTT
jgi:RNA 2',3'-cyclic 3'-phosphodiesterase